MSNEYKVITNREGEEDGAWHEPSFQLAEAFWKCMQNIHHFKDRISIDDLTYLFKEFRNETLNAAMRIMFNRLFFNRRSDLANKVRIKNIKNKDDILTLFSLLTLDHNIQLPIDKWIEELLRNKLGFSSHSEKEKICLIKDKFFHLNCYNSSDLSWMDFSPYDPDNLSNRVDLYNLSRDNTQKIFFGLFLISFIRRMDRVDRG